MATAKKRIELVLTSKDQGVSFISMVSRPAIEVGFFAFSKEQAVDVKEFKFLREEQMLAGPFMIPNIDIARNFDGEEVDVFILEKTIRRIAKKFFKEQRTAQVDVEHNNNPTSAFVFESWIIEDPQRDKSNVYGFTLPKGTWFGTVHVPDKVEWENVVKTGKVQGFSVEAALALKFSTQDMEKKEYKFSVMLKSGVVLVNEQDSDTLDVGDVVYVIDADGNATPAPDGEHEAEDGSVIVVAEGKITDIRDAVVQEEMKETPNVNEEFSKMKEEILAVVNDLSTRIAAMETKIAEGATQYEEMEKEFSKFKAQPGPSKVIKMKAKPEPEQKTKPEVKGAYKVSMSSLEANRVKG